MPCYRIGNAIVCTRARLHKCAACDQVAQYQCDWKLGAGKTCDRHLCDRHALEVAPDKHLCPEHQRAYDRWLADRRGRSNSPQPLTPSENP